MKKATHTQRNLCACLITCPERIITSRKHRLDYCPLHATAPALKKALGLYLKLDDDRRAGTLIEDKDWAECHQAASAALAPTKGESNKTHDPT